MKGQSKGHNGTVVGRRGRRLLLVRLDSGREKESCADCALVAVCSKAAEAVTVALPRALDGEYTPGTRIEVRRSSPGLAYLLPVIVFLALSIGGSYVGLSDLITLVFALTAAVAVSVAVWRRPRWKVAGRF